MAFVQHLALREAGLAPRRPRPVTSTVHQFTPSRTDYLPESSFNALKVNKYYRFHDSNETNEAPPLTMNIAGERLAVANDTGDVVLLNKQTMEEISKFSGHRSAIFDFKWRGINGNDTGLSGKFGCCR